MSFSTFFGDYWLYITTIIATLFAIAYVYVYNCFSYWKNKDIPHVRGTFPFGSLTSLFLQKTSLTEAFLDMYEKYEGDKYVGFYSFLQPEILIRDLDIIKNVLVKDFSSFVDRGVYFNEEIDPLSAHLFAIEGMQWRNLRAKLSPTFTSGKMKIMYPTVKECAEELQQYGLKLISTDDIVDMKDITGRYGLEVISSTALGLKGNNFNDDNTNMRKVAQAFSAPSTIQMFRIVLAITSRNISKLLRLRFTPKFVENYFLQVVKQNTEYREKNNVKRNDFMQLLIDMKNNNLEIQDSDGFKKGSQVTLTMKEMAAQSFVFVIAGFETTSVTLGFCMYELALNPHIQDKLIKELDSVNSELTYEILNQLPYLDMVVNETLRKYPPVPTIQRECSTDYTLPGGKVVEKGIVFVVSVIGLHLDPKLFPDPEKFDPERFNKDNVHSIHPYSYLPFGEGPRICIGMRFAKMQVKLAIASILSKFRVAKCERTPCPIVLEKKTFTYNAEGGMWLRLNVRKS